jgi:dehydrogenase/reductase SDR family protein 12
MNRLRNATDTLLELSVIGSFTRLGPAVRRRLFSWTDPAPDALRGRTALVTGPTSGLGRAAAEELATLGARVVLVGRSEDRLSRVRDELVARHGEDRFPVVVADMGSLDAVRAAANQVLATEQRLDVLVDNAGAIFPERTTGPDGIEATLALLVVGPFALIARLLPLLRTTGGARVISATSGGMYTQALALEDLQSTAAPFSGPLAYARAKRAQTTLIREWARRFPASGVTFHAMHPGWADTPGLAHSLPSFHRWMRPLLRSPGEGAGTITWLATAPEPEVRPLNGALVLDRRARPFDRVPWTRVTAGERRRLWDAIVALAALPDPSVAADPVTRSAGGTPRA